MIYCVYTDIHSISQRGDDNINIVLNPTADKPMYEQIKEQIRQAVISGELKNNELLPSVRQLAAQQNVSAITVKRAYSDLEHEGIIYTSAGKGTFVRAPDKSAVMEQYKQRRLAEFSQYADKMLSEGFTAEELIGAINIITERK
ncbi:GntR family transcriptional regulator [Huintestinicola sp.]|uniref:GntR family transcriptional regulator n=1 Tax=Huintestinicola sp. TaxID=2981661 RepID=UPI003D7D906D